MKVKHKPFDWKKLMMPVAIAVLVSTAMVGWNYLGKVLASPKKIETIEEAVIQQAETDRKQAETQDTLKNLYMEQRAINDRQDASIEAQKEVTSAQLDALKAIVLEVKKK